MNDSPNHAFVLMLPDVWRHLAINLPRAQCHCQSFRHVRLYSSWNSRILVCSSHPYFGCSEMFKLACTQLQYFRARYEGEDDIGRKSLFKMGLDTEGIGGVDENACLLRSDHRFYDSSHVVYVWQCFDAEENIVKSRISASGVFRSPNNYASVSTFLSTLSLTRIAIPLCGLNRSFPKSLDLATVSGILLPPANTHLNEMPY